VLARVIFLFFIFKYVNNEITTKKNKNIGLSNSTKSLKSTLLVQVNKK
jgi:hypothetical protein